MSDESDLTNIADKAICDSRLADARSILILLLILTQGHPNPKVHRNCVQALHNLDTMQLPATLRSLKAIRSFYGS